MPVVSKIPHWSDHRWGNLARTTLLRDHGEWYVLELCEPLEGLIDLGADVCGYDGPRDLLTIMIDWRWKGPSADGLQASRWGTSFVSWPRTSRCYWWRLASAWGWSAWLRNWWWGNSRWSWCPYARATGCDTITSWHGGCERCWTFRVKLFEGPSCWPYPLRFEHFRFKGEMGCWIIKRHWNYKLLMQQLNVPSRSWPGLQMQWSLKRRLHVQSSNSIFLPTFLTLHGAVAVFVLELEVTNMSVQVPLGDQALHAYHSILDTPSLYLKMQMPKKSARSPAWWWLKVQAVTFMWHLCVARISGVW